MFNLIPSYDSNGALIERLYQWDLNQTITVKHLDFEKAPVFHFCNRKSKESLAVQSHATGNGYTANVPNILLQQALKITAFIYYEGNGIGRTVFRTEIPVEPKPKPTDYLYDDNIADVLKNGSALLNEINEKIESAAKDAAQAVDLLTKCGGTNLLKNTNALKIGSNGEKINNGVLSESKNGQSVSPHILNVDDCPNAAVCSGFYLANDLDQWHTVSIGLMSNGKSTLNKKNTYTFSAYCRGTAEKIRLQLDYYNESGICSQPGISVSAKSDLWKRISYTFTVAADSEDIQLKAFTVSLTEKDRYVEICGLKIETGEIPTDWSPAPSDLLLSSYKEISTTNADELTSTPGTVFFDVKTQVLEGHESEDLAVMQVDSGADSFQLSSSGGHLITRQNDSGAAGGSWGDFVTVLDESHKGVKNGVASLDASGKIPLSQLPSAVLTASLQSGEAPVSDLETAPPSANSAVKIAETDALKEIRAQIADIEKSLEEIYGLIQGNSADINEAEKEELT